MRDANAAPPAATPPSTTALPASLVALGMVVLATGYFISHLRGASVDGPAMPDVVAGAASAPYAPLPAVPVPVVDLATRSPSPPDAAPASRPATKPPVKRTKALPPPAPVAVDEPPVDRIAAADPLPTPVRTAKAEAPDRWQLLAEAVARCADGGGLGSLICEQRARWHYCDGYWNKVAQCPGAMASDYPR